MPITINSYIKTHLKNNPGENEKELRKRLNSALSDYKKGIKCSCENDIWVIGSASVGNSCFNCITGESYPTDDYEIESAIKKGENIKGMRHINKITPSKIAGFFNDDGYEINSDLIKKPSLCITCINDDNPNEEMFCNMVRYDLKDDKEFNCFAYKAIKT
ncbi:MAG: hypothetical protein RQ864_12905 [Lutibacter sp.]|nr:hypothetical protein [Lutibacter sp.]